MIATAYCFISLFKANPSMVLVNNPSAMAAMRQQQLLQQQQAAQARQALIAQQFQANMQGMPMGMQMPQLSPQQIHQLRQQRMTPVSFAHLPCFYFKPFAHQITLEPSPGAGYDGTAACSSTCAASATTSSSAAAAATGTTASATGSTSGT